MNDQDGNMHALNDAQPSAPSNKENADPNSATDAFRNLSPDEILDAVESIGLMSDGRLLALNSYENRVYQVGLEDDNPIIAKFYRPNRWADAAIQEEHDYTLELADEEIPVVPPTRIDGKTLHHYGPYRFAIYERRGGRAPELDNPEHLEQLGRFVGRIHKVAGTKKFTDRPTINVEQFAQIPRTFLLENNFMPAHLAEAYEGLSDDVIKRIGLCFERAGKIDHIRLHCDFHPGNILWRDDKPNIVDFDDARMGPAIQDLWMFLSGDRQYMTARLGDLLVGYEDFCEFNPAELNLVEALRAMRIMHHAYWLANRWDDPAFPLAFPWFNSDHYWEEHILSLREQAAHMQEEPLVWD